MLKTAVTRPSTRRKMLRKQIYLLPQQDTKLKSLAYQQQTTEAELIRQAVEVFLSQPQAKSDKHLPPDEAAWQEILASFEEARTRNLTSEPQHWTREDYYEDPRYRREWSS